MPRFREMSVSAPRASSLLSEYFAERAATFPAAQGGYRTATPVDATFAPPAGVFVVLEEGDDASAEAPALACGGVRRLDTAPGAPVRYEVKHLFVSPSARGRGLGRTVLHELERRARRFGADEVVLDTNDSLEAAGGLYRSAGYTAITPYNDNPNATAWYGKPLG